MRTARGAALRALVALEKGKTGRLDSVLDRRGMADRDRALALEVARGVERRRIFLDAVLDAFVKKPPRDPRVRTALRLGAYQLLELSRIPAYAAVAETVGLLQAGRGRGFANAVLRRIAGQVADRAADPGLPRREVALGDARAFVLERDWLPDPGRDPAGYHAVLHGLPRWIVARWQEHFGAATAERLAAASARTPAVFLRANQRLGSAAELRDMLAAEGIETEPTDHPLLLRWSGGATPFGGAAYQAGWFSVQDPTALRAVEAIGARAGEVIADLCAGPGTKASVLAEQVGSSGRVHGYDVSEARRKPIRANAKRLRLEGILEVHDDLEAIPVADRVLVDVPCSNTGVLARRVEVRRRLHEGSFAELAATQRQLLDKALRMVRRGGVVGYSTCSIEPEENDGILEAVLHDQHQVLRRELTLPDPPRHDGGFIAVVRVGAE